jgi:tetratricopeptide (TPR) repeat protein
MKRVPLVACLVAGTLVASAPAQEQPPKPPVAADDAKVEIAGLIDLARPLVAKGSYLDAISNLKKVLTLDPSNAEAALLLAAAHRDLGEYDKAIEVLKPFDRSVAALTLRAELLFARGDEAGADAAAKKAVELDALALPALIVVGRIQEATGHRDEAVATYEDVNRRWSKTDDAQETDDMLLADARARLGIYRLSSEHEKNLDSVVSRLEIILKRSPERYDAIVETGDLYLAAYKDVDAKKWYGKALEKNAHYAPALFGKVRQMAFRYEETEAAKVCEDLLRQDPNYVPALLFLARQALGDANYEKAAGFVGTALAVNSVDSETRATHAALAYLKGDAAAFETEAKSILARDKYASVAYRVLGNALEEQRRFEEALKFAEMAVAADPLDWDASFLAGRNALNVGDDAKGEKYLLAAEKGDAFPNIFRHNFLELFRQTRNFSVRKDAKFVTRIPPAEEEPYYRLLKTHMDASIDFLQKKWNFNAAMPVYVSVFDKQADFATRTIGLPGFPALGACFGQVVTLDSPRALPPGAFGWNSTQHHELAHVITLQLSKGRISRWLTEGLSVYEERKQSKTWNRDDERDLIDAIWSDEVLTLKDINNAFRGPRVLFAYYQGGLMCEWIERDFGFDKLRAMVVAYGEPGATEESVVKTALGLDAAEFDRRFLAYAKDYVKDFKVMRRITKSKSDKLRRALRKTPDDGEGWLLLTEGALAQGDTAAALSALSNAARILPNDGRIPAMRAMAAWRENKPELAVQHAEEALKKGTDLYELRMGLADWYSQPGRSDEKAKEHWKRAIELNPTAVGPGAPRLLLAKQLTAEGEKNLDEVLALMRAHSDVDETDVGTRKALAGMYSQHGKFDDEMKVLEEMRDVAPLPNLAPAQQRPGGKSPAGPPRGWTRENALAIHERLGELYLERKRYADAELAYACAVGVARMDVGSKDDPPLEGAAVADLLAHQAEALHLLGKADEARARLDEAKRLDPENEAVKKLEQSISR